MLSLVRTPRQSNFLADANPPDEDQRGGTGKVSPVPGFLPQFSPMTVIKLNPELQMSTKLGSPAVGIAIKAEQNVLADRFKTAVKDCEVELKKNLIGYRQKWVQ